MSLKTVVVDVKAPSWYSLVKQKKPRKSESGKLTDIPTWTKMNGKER
jgi:hypothetical protein